MMQEDKYPDFLSIYRELRSEGIVFPARDPNARDLIKYEGDASPAFELAELEDNVERARNENQDIDIGAPAEKEEDKELTVDDLPMLSYTDLDDLKLGIEYLDEITRVADSQETLLTEESTTKYRKARAVQKKLLVLVSARATKV